MPWSDRPPGSEFATWRRRSLRLGWRIRGPPVRLMPRTSRGSGKPASGPQEVFYTFVPTLTTSSWPVVMSRGTTRGSPVFADGTGLNPPTRRHGYLAHGFSGQDFSFL